MAITVAVTFRDQTGSGRWIVKGTCTMDSSYPTGGETAIVAADLTVGAITAIDYFPHLGYVPGITTTKLLAYWCDYDAVADGALTEVADTTNLSTVVFPFTAYCTAT